MSMLKMTLSRNVIFFVVCLSFIVGGNGCTSGIYGGGSEELTHDTAKRFEKARGLNFEILSFDWIYREDVDQIEVFGWAVNKTGQPVQALRLIVTGTDQRNRVLGTSETYLQPTYIIPGQKAKFSFYLNGDRKVKSLHLRYHFLTRN